MKRFDKTEAGENLGFEDFSSLQALGTNKKYDSTYEGVARTINDFVSPERLSSAREQFFATLVLSAMVRNGDAHLKNFGVLYRHLLGPMTLAPAYDIVTTTASRQKTFPPSIWQALKNGGRATSWRDLPYRPVPFPQSRPATQIIDRVAGGESKPPNRSLPISGRISPLGKSVTGCCQSGKME